jgi:hypothetical protein
LHLGEKSSFLCVEILICLVQHLLKTSYFNSICIKNSILLLRAVIRCRSQELLIIIPNGRGTTFLILIEFSIVFSRPEQLKQVQLQLLRVELPKDLVHVVHLRVSLLIHDNTIK